ncbi:MAG: alpha/beta hydrolase [Candidatus Saccharibacteria bacterium]|nr:alpha/beta hydrolase [Candidatus Saccharibacteria bacterium]
MQENYNSGDLHYEEHGSGNDVVVLVHGFLSSSSYWSRIRPSLVRAGYKVISIDLLGFGDAMKPQDIEYGYSDQVEYVGQIARHLKLETFTLIGHSMGALIAARYAILHPAKLKYLVLLHPPLYMNTTEANNTLINTSMLYRYLLRSKYRNIAWKVIRCSIPGIIAKHSHDAREKSLMNIIVKAELFTDLQKMKTNTLLLVGLKDRPIYLDNLANVPLRLPVKVIKENVDHHSPIKYPTLVQNLILDFISKQS